MHPFYLVLFVTFSSCVSLAHSTLTAVRGVGTPDNDRDPPKASLAGSHLSSSVLHHLRLNGLSVGETDSPTRETTHPISISSPFANATVTRDQWKDSSVRSMKRGDNEKKQEDSVNRTKRVSLPTDNTEFIRSNVQTPLSSPPQTSPSSSEEQEEEEEEDHDADLLVEGDEVEDDDKKTTSDESIKRLLYKLTKTSAPTASGLLPGILLGCYALFLLLGRRSKSEMEAEKKEFLEEFPFVPERYADVVLHPATPFAIGGASAALLANYAYTRHKAKTYERLMKRSLVDKDVSSDERLKALDELLLFIRDHHGQPPINGTGGLVAAALPFIAQQVGLVTMFHRILGVPREKQGRLSVGTKFTSAALALFAAYRLGESLWRRRKYHQKIKELSAKKPLTVYTEKMMRLLMMKKKKMKTTAFTDVGQQVKENTTETGREEQRDFKKVV